MYSYLSLLVFRRCDEISVTPDALSEKSPNFLQGGQKVAE